MKTISSFPRAALLALALTSACATAAFAQTTPTPAPATTPPPADTGGRHGESVLTPEEKAQLDKDREAALAANPALKTEEDSLKQQHEALKAQGASAPAGSKEALKAQFKAFEEKLDVAMLAIDPSLAPILAKLKAAHKERHHDAGA